MGRILILNGSPRAAKSNSKVYIQAFLTAWSGPYSLYSVTEGRHQAFLEELEGCTDLLLVFPLYTDGLPSGLMEFLQTVLAAGRQASLRVHMAVNCGFREPEQNDVAADMVRLFCRRGGFTFGACLLMGCGEAFPVTPFRGLAERKLRRLAVAVARGEPVRLTAAMPLTRRLFLRAANRYWRTRGAANGLTPEQMAVLEIEPS